MENTSYEYTVYLDNTFSNKKNVFGTLSRYFKNWKYPNTYVLHSKTYLSSIFAWKQHYYWVYVYCIQYNIRPNTSDRPDYNNIIFYFFDQNVAKFNRDVLKARNTRRTATDFHTLLHELLDETGSRARDFWTHVGRLTCNRECAPVNDFPTKKTLSVEQHRITIRIIITSVRVSNWKLIKQYALDSL